MFRLLLVQQTGDFGFACFLSLPYEISNVEFPRGSIYSFIGVGTLQSSVIASSIHIDGYCWLFCSSSFALHSLTAVMIRFVAREASSKDGALVM